MVSHEAFEKAVDAVEKALDPLEEKEYKDSFLWSMIDVARGIGSESVWRSSEQSISPSFGAKFPKEVFYLGPEQPSRWFDRFIPYWRWRFRPDPAWKQQVQEVVLALQGFTVAEVRSLMTRMNFICWMMDQPEAQRRHWGWMPDQPASQRSYHGFHPIPGITTSWTNPSTEASHFESGNIQDAEAQVLNFREDSGAPSCSSCVTEPEVCLCRYPDNSCFYCSYAWGLPKADKGCELMKHSKKEQEEAPKQRRNKNIPIFSCKLACCALSRILPTKFIPDTWKQDLPSETKQRENTPGEKPSKDLK